MVNLELEIQARPLELVEVQRAVTVRVHDLELPFQADQTFSTPFEYLLLEGLELVLLLLLLCCLWIRFHKFMLSLVVLLVLGVIALEGGRQGVSSGLLARHLVIRLRALTDVLVVRNTLADGTASLFVVAVHVAKRALVALQARTLVGSFVDLLVICLVALGHLA